MPDEHIAALVDDVLIEQALDTCDPMYRDEVAYVLRLARQSLRALVLTEMDKRIRAKLIYEETIRANVPAMLADDTIQRSIILSRLRESLIIYPD